LGQISNENIQTLLIPKIKYKTVRLTS